MRTRLEILLLAGLLNGASCVSYESALAEFDGLAGYDPAAMVEPARLEYQGRTRRFPALLRSLDWLAGGSFLAGFLGAKRVWTEVDDPQSFARERLAELPDLAGRNLFRLADVAWRQVLVLERDPSLLSRRIAVEGLLDCMKKAGARLGAGELPDWEPVPDIFERRGRTFSRRLERFWPPLREKRLTEGEAADYRGLCRDLASLPPGSPGQERALLRLFLEAVRTENDPRVYEAEVEGLKTCMRRIFRTGMRIALADLRSGLVRGAALEACWNRGGAEVLPDLLGIFQNRSRRIAGNGAPIDPDPGVRRRFVHLCWRLRPDEAEVSRGEGSSPMDFLHEAAVRDPDRSVALLARIVLAWLVRREVDPYGDWIPGWWEQRVIRRRKGSGA